MHYFQPGASPFVSCNTDVDRAERDSKFLFAQFQPKQYRPFTNFGAYMCKEGKGGVRKERGGVGSQRGGEGARGEGGEQEGRVGRVGSKRRGVGWGASLGMLVHVEARGQHQVSSPIIVLIIFQYTAFTYFQFKLTYTVVGFVLTFPPCLSSPPWL